MPVWQSLLKVEYHVGRFVHGGSVVESNSNVQYELVRIAGKRRMTIRVTSDAQVVVTAGTRFSPAQVDAFVQSHRTWIDKKRAFMESLPPALPPHEWTDGEQLVLFDRFVKLAVSQGRPNAVVRVGDVLQVTVGKPGPSTVRKAVVGYYATVGEQTYRPLVDRWCRTLALAPQSWPRSVSMAAFPVRMGSCSKLGDIKFALRSLMLPPDLIEYLALHETAHLVHFDHGRSFKAVLDEHMPDWRERRRRLTLLYKRCSAL
jgi:predicted metal-dependent hydrolase